MQIHLLLIVFGNRVVVICINIFGLILLVVKAIVSIFVGDNIRLGLVQPKLYYII